MVSSGAAGAQPDDASGRGRRGRRDGSRHVRPVKRARLCRGTAAGWLLLRSHQPSDRARASLVVDARSEGRPRGQVTPAKSPAGRLYRGRGTALEDRPARRLPSKSALRLQATRRAVHAAREMAAAAAATAERRRTDHGRKICGERVKVSCTQEACSGQCALPRPKVSCTQEACSGGGRHGRRRHGAAAARRHGARSAARHGARGAVRRTTDHGPRFEPGPPPLCRADGGGARLTAVSPWPQSHEKIGAALAPNGHSSAPIDHAPTQVGRACDT